MTRSAKSRSVSSGAASICACETGETAFESSCDSADEGPKLEAIAAQAEVYPALLADVSDADLRAEIVMFGHPSTRGAFLVNQVLCGCAAYRTQLFLYLKACGREELSTMNLWAGMDAPAPA